MWSCAMIQRESTENRNGQPEPQGCVMSSDHKGSPGLGTYVKRSSSDSKGARAVTYTNTLNYRRCNARL